MSNLVIDSSLFSKIFLEEEETLFVRKFLVELVRQRIHVIVPSIFEYELFSIIKKYSLPFDELYPMIYKQLGKIIQVLHLNEAITKKAYEITQQGSTKSGFPSFYDAAYHALAIINDCDFVTADKKHYAKTKHLGHIKLLSDIEINQYQF